MTLPLGKLPTALLESLLKRSSSSDPRVIVGPAIGEDAAVLEVSPEADWYLVAKTDPITFATEEIGWYAVHVNANDIAATGATPHWFMASLLLPEGKTDPHQVEGIFDQLNDACASLGISLVGGHTEITHGLDRPMVAGVMLGTVAKQDMITTAGARPGDRLLLTKGVPIEATALIAKERSQELRRQGVSPELLRRARSLLKEPGISVVQDARIATSRGRVHALHDPTEGGLKTGLWELARASGRRLNVDCSGTVLKEGESLCRATGLDPLGALASGALIVSVHPQDAANVRHHLERAGIRCYDIGQVEEGEAEVVDSENRRLPYPERDEVARLFA